MEIIASKKISFEWNDLHIRAPKCSYSEDAVLLGPICVSLQQNLEFESIFEK